MKMILVLYLFFDLSCFDNSKIEDTLLFYLGKKFFAHYLFFVVCFSISLVLFISHFPDFFFLLLSLHFFLLFTFCVQQFSSMLLTIGLMQMSLGNLKVEYFISSAQKKLKKNCFFLIVQSIVHSINNSYLYYR